MKGSAWSIKRLKKAGEQTENDVLDFLIDNKEPCFQGSPILDILAFGRDPDGTVTQSVPFAFSAHGLDRCGTAITSFHRGHDRFICEKPL